MHEIYLFCEDYAHKEFITALIERLRNEYQISCRVRPLAVTGGHGRMLDELQAFVSDLEAYPGLPDLIVVARDSNCRGLSETQNEIEEVVGHLSSLTLILTPDPHIERWLLLDSRAFKSVLGQGCSAPDEKCDRDRYKNLLAEAVRESGVNPSPGGVEYADDIVRAMDLDRMITADDSLGRCIQSLRQRFRQWSEE